MTVLLDANILLRIADLSAPLRPVAVAAVSVLTSDGDLPIIVPQSLYEFWVVATRPKNQNGLGLTIQQCQAEIAGFRKYYPLLPDASAVTDEWESLVVAHACRGKVAHDARYVAAMNTHGVTRLLTFNTADFARYPHITVLDPRIVAAAVPPTPGPGTPSGPAP